MEKDELKKVAEALSIIRKYCDKSTCDNCHFKGYNTCMFFNQPWNWDLGIIEDKL